MNTALTQIRRQWPLLFLLLSAVAGLFLQSQVNGAKTAARDARDAAAIARRQEKQLKQANLTSCLSRNAARVESNKHIRVPLKAMLTYAATLERQAAADKTIPRKYRRQAVAVGKRFDQFAALIVPLDPLKCAPER